MLFLVCALMGGFMAWRHRYLSSWRPSAIPSYLAGFLGGPAGAYGGRMFVQDPGSLGGEVALVLLFSIGGARDAAPTVLRASRPPLEPW